MSIITSERLNNIAVIRSNNPPVNALGLAVREGLTTAIAEAEQDSNVAAMVIICDGQTFFAGADISEFGKPMQPPHLPTVVTALEACTKPIVAAIHGTALGGGLEVALGCHYRVSVTSAKFGLPEVKLGLLPGAGGTQRLPRVAGVTTALQMATSGSPITAAQAAAVGLVDHLVDGDLLEGALAFAASIATVSPLPRASQRNEKLEEARQNPALFDEFRQANARKFNGFDAPEANIRAIEAAVNLPFNQGVKEELRLFMELMGGVQAKAQQYFFFAERQASKIDDIPADTPIRDIKTVGVIGAGTMGGGIAMNFLSAGIPVTIVETSQAALDRGLGIIHKNYQATVNKGRLSQAKADAAMSLLTPSLAYDDLADCDLVIEAVFERMDIKKAVFTQLDGIVKQGAILASNTSYLDIDEIAACTQRPQDVLGLHFFSPANVMKLLEVVRGRQTANDVMATVMKLAKKIRKVAVISGVCWGFIGNRIIEPRQLQAESLLLEGGTPEHIDKVHLDFGMPMGPFQMGDLAGVDLGWHRNPEIVENVREKLCSINRLGQKTGAGFYDYDENRRPTPSDEAKQAIADYARTIGYTEKREDISALEITERTLYIMINEGAKILEEGIAQRASDIDVVYVYGYGWPVYRGGPMFWADTIGLQTIVDGLKKQQDQLGEDFTISQLLLDKAANGQCFTR